MQLSKTNYYADWFGNIKLKFSSFVKTLKERQLQNKSWPSEFCVHLGCFNFATNITTDRLWTNLAILLQICLFFSPPSYSLVIHTGKHEFCLQTGWPLVTAWWYFSVPPLSLLTFCLLLSGLCVCVCVCVHVCVIPPSGLLRRSQ